MKRKIDKLSKRRRFNKSTTFNQKRKNNIN